MRSGPATHALPRLASAVLLALTVLAVARFEAAAQPPGKKGNTKPTAPPAPPEAWLKSDVWKDVPTTPLKPDEIDQLLEKQLQESKVPPVPLTGDEQFLRRVRLDLTGQLPKADEIETFVADKDADKRAKLIDKLLDSDEYARHWARYWRETVGAVDAPFGESIVAEFEEWLYEQFKKNSNWGEITRGMIMAEGDCRKDSKKNGAVFFLGRFNGPDGDDFRTGETARVFLGIQIQCAQCHNDRRTQIWKQVQFHEMAGFFARMGVGGSSGQLVKITTKNNGEHQMADRKDPSLKYVTTPRFLDGQEPAANLSDKERRKALADYLTSKDNYWFSAAYVNRLWTEMLGQGFYDRVDDLSPRSDMVFPAIAVRLASAFRGSDYDSKALLRAIANSKAYQRQVRMGEGSNDHLHFTAVYPTRLRGDVLWQSLQRVLVQLPLLDDRQGKAFKTEFNYDPSSKADEVVGTIPQALWLMNSQLVNDRLKAADVTAPRPTKPDPMKKPTSEATLLKQLLAKHTSDDAAAVRDMYLRTMARKPSDLELQTCLAYIKETKEAKGTRNDAFEDVLKALINSTEFQRKR